MPYIWNVTLFKLTSFCDNTQYLAHNKSSPTSQMSKGKSSDLQKILRYLSEIVTSMFKGGTTGD